jgi:hypothetical protein
VLTPDTVREFLITRTDNRTGEVQLSVKKIETEILWQRLRQLRDHKVYVHAAVVQSSANRSGALVDYFGQAGQPHPQRARPPRPRRPARLPGRMPARRVGLRLSAAGAVVAARALCDAGVERRSYTGMPQVAHACSARRAPLAAGRQGTLASGALACGAARPATLQPSCS